MRPAVAAVTQQAVRGQNVPVHDMCGVHYGLRDCAIHEALSCRYWHKADIKDATADVRFWSKQRTLRTADHQSEGYEPGYGTGVGRIMRRLDEPRAPPIELQ